MTLRKLNKKIAIFTLLRAKTTTAYIDIISRRYPGPIRMSILVDCLRQVARILYDGNGVLPHLQIGVAVMGFVEDFRYS